MITNDVQVVRTTSLPDAPHVPVAIVGAGACGLTAAIGLRERGIEQLAVRYRAGIAKIGAGAQALAIPAR